MHLFTRSKRQNYHQSNILGGGGRGQRQHPKIVGHCLFIWPVVWWLIRYVGDMLSQNELGGTIDNMLNTLFVCALMAQFCRVSKWTFILAVPAKKFSEPRHGTRARTRIFHSARLTRRPLHRGILPWSSGWCRLPANTRRCCVHMSCSGCRNISETPRNPEISSILRAHVPEHPPFFHQLAQQDILSTRSNYSW